MSHLQPDPYSSGVPHQQQHMQAMNHPLSQDMSAGGVTSSGPVSSYATATNSADQSTGTGASPATYSSINNPGSGNMASTPNAGPGSMGASPFHTHGMMSTGPLVPAQPGSGGYAPSSSSYGGAGGYMSSSSGQTQHMYPSSNGPSTFSGSMASQMNGMQPSSGMGYANVASYPAMAPVGSQPLPYHGPMSSVGPMVGPPLVGMDSAAAHEQAKRMADAAAEEVGAMGDRANLLQFRPKLGDKLLCTCPMVCLVNSSRGMGPNTVPQAVPLETSLLQYSVQCHISQAFVDLLLVCQFPPTWPDMPCVFFLPKTTDTTITEITINNAVRPTVQTTMVVPIEDFRKYGGKRSAMLGDNPDDPSSKLDPELFMLPITNTAPGDRYEVRVKYFHPMHFDTVNGRYVLELPTVVPKECLPQGVNVKAVLEATVAIDTAMGEEVDLMVNYPNKVADKGPGSISFEVDNGSDMAWPQCDLVVQYGVWRDSITAVVQIEPPAPEAGDALGTFALSVMPPGPESSVCFPRDIIFVFDRSGSMTGEPMRYAKAALLTGLLKLDLGDRFGVVAFDHDQQWWSDQLVYATPENIRTCMMWVNDDISARGTTDIKTPLSQALRMLRNAPSRSDEIRLPLVFMLTDGCVDNEREICNTTNNILKGTPVAGPVPLITVDAGHKMVDAGQLVGLGMDTPAPLAQKHSQLSDSAMGQPNSGTTQDSAYISTGAAPASEWHSNGSSIAQPLSAISNPKKLLAPRIFTFGIGPYCNHYFLKRLAVIGRGMNDVAFRAHAIQATMEQMLHAAALPILSDVQLSVPGLSHLQLFPDPIPDVFVGQPLLVSGKFAGPWPELIHISGTLPSGELYRHEVRTMPPQLSGGQLPLDSIFAKSQLDQLVADAWLQNNPPAMVEQILSLSLRRNIPVANFTVTVGFETTPQKMQQMQSLSPDQRRKNIVKYAIGGAAGILAVGGVAAALAFGSLAMTAGELPIGDIMSGADMGELFSGLGDMGDCCGGCGECCGDCGDICGACVTC